MLIPEAFDILSEANLKIASLGVNVVDQKGTPKEPKTVRQLIRVRQLFNLLMKFVLLNEDGDAIAGTFGEDDDAINRLLLVLKKCAGIEAFPVIPNPIHTFVVDVNEAIPGPIGPIGPQGPQGLTGMATDFQVTTTVGPSTTIIDSFPMSDAPAARWDYFVQEVGGAQRSGTVLGHWLADQSDEGLFDDSAPDLDSGSTLGISFDIQYSGVTVQLVAVVTSGTWLVRGSRYYIPNNGNGSGPVSNVLANGLVYIGNSLNFAQARSVSGVISITNTGVTNFNTSAADSIVSIINASGTTDISLAHLASVTANRVLISSSLGKITTSTVTNTTLSYLDIGSSLVGLLNAKLTDPTTSIGDLIIRNGSNVIARLAAGAPTQVLTMVGGVPQWATSATGFVDPSAAPGDMIFRNGANVSDRLLVGPNGYVIMSMSGFPSYQPISQLTVTGGDKFKRVNLSNPNTYGLGTTISTGTQAGNTGRAYPSTSFTTPNESIWKVFITCEFQVTGDGGGVDQIFAIIEKSTDNASWSSTGNQISVASDNGSHTFVTLTGFDTSVSPGTLYYYRLVAINNIGGQNNFFSANAGYKIHLIPA